MFYCIPYSSWDIVALSVNVTELPIGLPEKTVTLRTINNTNGIVITEVVSNGSGIFTCKIATPNPVFPIDPFSVGDKVFIEGIQKVGTAGSGFIISKDGFIVTNNHVVEEAEKIKITLSNDEVYEAEIIGLDPRMDLALLKIDSDKDLPFAGFGKSENSKVGEWVVAIGNPFGLGGTVTAGIISALGRNIGSGPYDQFIQTDAPINKGNSGGPLFNMKGEVIGVNTMIYSQTGGSVGIGFSIPSSLVKPVIDQLKEYGETRRGWLGVMIQNVNEELAKDMDLDEAKGALVQQVVKDGPADKGGIKEGDVIIGYNKEDINDMRDLTTKVANTDIGKRIKIRLIRFGKEIELKVKIGRLEGNENKFNEDIIDNVEKILGLGLGDLSENFRRENQIPPSIKGVAVITVDENSEAFSKKIAKGSVIISLTHQRVSGNVTLQSTVKAESYQQVYDLLNQRKKEGDERILLRVWRPELRLVSLVAVSYTHLTLPTNREV